MTIAENLVLAARRGQPRGLGLALKSEMRRELHERVARLNLGPRASPRQRRSERLSGGQRQALTLLMASWVKPRLLLLDEHTAALDPKSADHVIRLSQDIVSRDRLTTLMVTHSMQQASNLGDRLIMMHRGASFTISAERNASGCVPRICSPGSRPCAGPSGSTKPPRKCCAERTSRRPAMAFGFPQRQ